MVIQRRGHEIPTQLQLSSLAPLSAVMMLILIPEGSSLAAPLCQILSLATSVISHIRATRGRRLPGNAKSRSREASRYHWCPKVSPHKASQQSLNHVSTSQPSSSRDASRSSIKARKTFSHYRKPVSCIDCGCLLGASGLVIVVARSKRKSSGPGCSLQKISYPPM
jgi:hypothetical protein